MVANFTQLLAERYGAELDDDAREFIAYAVGRRDQDADFDPGPAGAIRAWAPRGRSFEAGRTATRRWSAPCRIFSSPLPKTPR